MLYCKDRGGEIKTRGQTKARDATEQRDGHWWGRGGDRYRFGVPRHLHEGGVLEEPEFGGGDGAVLPDGHGRGGWRERSQGLVTWAGGATMSRGDHPHPPHHHGAAVLTAPPTPRIS